MTMTFIEELNHILLSNDSDKLILEHFAKITNKIPELLTMKDFKQHNPYHAYDVLTHTLIVLKNTPADLTLRLSALFHDIGKPECFTIDHNGIGHFYGHNLISKKIASNILKRLGYEEAISRDVLALIEYHDYPLYCKEKAIKKLFTKIKPELMDRLLVLKKADIMGQNPKLIARLQGLEEVKHFIEQMDKQ